MVILKEKNSRSINNSILYEYFSIASPWKSWDNIGMLRAVIPKIVCDVTENPDLKIAQF